MGLVVKKRGIQDGECSVESVVHMIIMGHPKRRRGLFCILLRTVGIERPTNLSAGVYVIVQHFAAQMELTANFPKVVCSRE